MAQKQLIQNALKDIDLESVKNNRFLLKKSKKGNQPFFDKAIKIFLGYKVGKIFLVQQALPQVK